MMICDITTLVVMVMRNVLLFVMLSAFVVGVSNYIT